MIVAPWGNGPAGGTSARFYNDGADNIDTTTSSKNCRDPVGPAVKPEVIPEKKSEVFSWFVDRLDLILDRINKKFEWFRKWLDEMDRHILVFPNPGCS
ncbi:hypothetical protein [Methanoregula sp.]|uniref:hypothetical protein n=1 Tax=Methanoregula sp. TaxID=2052170 RepID=UPI003C71E423